MLGVRVPARLSLCPWSPEGHATISSGLEEAEVRAAAVLGGHCNVCVVNSVPSSDAAAVWGPNSSLRVGSEPPPASLLMKTDQSISSPLVLLSQVTKRAFLFTLVLSCCHNLPWNPLFPAVRNNHAGSSHPVVKVGNEELLGGAGKEHFSASTPDAAASTPRFCCLWLLAFSRLLIW